MANPIKRVKETLAIRTRAKKVFERRGSEYVVLESSISMVFFTLAFLVFLPLLNRDSDALRVLIVVYGLFVIVWALITVYDYLVKSSRLLANTKVHNYSIIAGLNAILGLALPVFVINSVASIIAHTLGAMNTWGTAICEIRMSFVRFYNASNFYNQGSSLVFWIVVFAFGLITVGALLERISKSK